MTGSSGKRIADLFSMPLDYWKGLVHFRMKKWDEADACFEAACLKKPDDAECLFKRGLTLIKKKQWWEAFPFIQKAIFLDPSQSRWLVQFRDVERHLDDLRFPGFLVTEEEFLRRIEELPGCSFLHCELARVLRAAGKRWQEVEALKTAVGIDSGSPEPHYRLAMALEGMKRNEEAAGHYEKAVSLGPPNPLWFYQLGHAMATEGHDGAPDPERARMFYQKAVLEQANDEAKGLGIGPFHEKFERWSLAADAYVEQLARSPGDARVHHRLGTCFSRLYDWVKAAESYKAAISLDGGFPEWHYRLGIALERLHDYQGAAESYQRAIRLNDAPPPYWSYRLGYVLEKCGEFTSSCDAYEDALKEAVVKAELEAATADAGRPMSAGELEAAVANDMTDAAVWMELGRCHVARSRWREAADAFRQAVMRGERHDPLWYLSLGRSLRKQGLEEEACAVLGNSRILRRAYGIPGDAFKHDPGLRKVAYYTEYYETLDISAKTVLYESFHGKVMSCNPYALFLHLLRDPDFADWTHVWAVNDMSVVPERFKRMRNVIFVIRNSDPYMRCLASARLLINNVTFFPYFIRRSGQIYLNTWHGTPWKMLGKDVRQEFLTYGNMSRNFLHATHILSQNAHTTAVLVNGYDIGGLAHGVIAETGYPRIDLTLNATAEEKSALRGRLGISGSRKVALYAPTWRGSHAAPEQEFDELLREVAQLKKEDCHVLFRGHTLSGATDADINVPDDISTNELLSIVDVLITDYSSIAFDFMVTGKPILFYLKDYEEYRSERGLYFGVESLPGEAAFSLDELSLAFRRVLEGRAPKHPGYDEALRTFCPFEDGSACRRVVDWIFSATEPVAADRSRHSILMFGGKFIPNGITSSLTNLLAAVDHEKVRVTVPVEPNLVSEFPENVKCFQRLGPAVGVLPRVGRLCLTPEEKWMVDYFKRNSTIPETPEAHALYQGIYAREFTRLFGRSSFDAVVDFEGYNVFWASVLGCAPAGSAGHKTIYQHNDLLGECRKRFPTLEQIFHLYRNFDRLVSVSKMTMDLNIASLARRYGLPESKFDFAENVLIPEVVGAQADLPLDSPAEEAWFGSGVPVFVTLGRLSIEKDHQKLIRAFSRLRKQGREARLLIIGDGPLLSDLKRQVSRLDLEDHVILAGFRGNPFPYLRRADCFVLSSNHEGQPMVLLEAIILGKPIIATDIVGSRGVIEGRSGLLVENSAAGLTQGMLDFLDGRVTASHVDMQAYLRGALHDFYRKTCAIAG